MIPIHCRSVRNLRWFIHLILKKTQCACLPCFLLKVFQIWWISLFISINTSIRIKSRYSVIVLLLPILFSHRRIKFLSPTAQLWVAVQPLLLWVMGFDKTPLLPFLLPNSRAWRNRPGLWHLALKEKKSENNLT